MKHKDTMPTVQNDWVIPVAAMLVTVGAGLLFFHTKTTAKRFDNVASRYATVEALGNQGTYIIDDTQYISTIDKVMIDHHYYSSKPPLLPTATAGVYIALRAVTGWGGRLYWSAICLW